MGWLDRYLERSIRPWLDWLSDHPGSALCEVTVTEVNRLLRENLDFWMGSSPPDDVDAIAALLERYESSVSALPCKLRTRALLGAAEAWVRIHREEEAHRLYRDVHGESGCRPVRAR